jgi:hypothetical protein
VERYNLAAALGSYGNRLNDLGRHAEALAAATESVERFRELDGE